MKHKMKNSKMWSRIHNKFLSEFMKGFLEGIATMIVIVLIVIFVVYIASRDSMKKIPPFISVYHPTIKNVEFKDTNPKSKKNNKIETALYLDWEDNAPCTGILIFKEKFVPSYVVITVYK